MNNNKGQALIEFIFYLPALMILYFIILSIGNSINGSINQQKVSRGYYFARIKNNSYVPKPEWNRANGYPADWQLFGMSVLGYKINTFGESEEGDNPESACYRTPLASIPTNSRQIASSTNAPKALTDPGCEEPYEEPRTQNIRVYTVFGICGATYQNVGGVISVRSDSSNVQGCLIN